jgi:hypothetical protein
MKTNAGRNRKYFIGNHMIPMGKKDIFRIDRCYRFSRQSPVVRNQMPYTGIMFDDFIIGFDIPRLYSCHNKIFIFHPVSPVRNNNLIMNLPD